MNLTIGSLFAGIGGLDRGLEAAGLGPVLWQVELDPFARRVLAKHWPDVDRSVEDVRNAGSSTLAPVDVICGGFPCQDVSVAGAGAGLSGERSGLWFEYARIVRGLAPRFVVIENVPGLIRRGLDRVVSDLADAGYTVEATRIRAEDLGAPHRRERVFIVAHSDRVRELQSQGPQPDERRRSGHRWTAVANSNGDELWEQPGRCSGEDGTGQRFAGGCSQELADALRSGREGADRKERKSVSCERAWNQGSDVTESGMGRDADGLPGGLDSGRWPAGPGPQFEWEPPRIAAGVASRWKRLKALGNSVIPACAYVAGRRVIEIAERLERAA